MKKFAVIVAGGSGLRMGTAIPKQFLLLQGKPLLWYTLTAFFTAYQDVQVVLVLPETYFGNGHAIAAALGRAGSIRITAGGDTRYESVKNGLQLVQQPAIVFVHDGVRCLITPELIKICYEAALEKGNAVPAVSPVDSIRIITGKSNVIADRKNVRMIQTPQTFTADILLKAFEQKYEPAFLDEATVVEKSGIRINLVTGDASNIKITTPGDLLLAEKILEARTQIH